MVTSKHIERDSPLPLYVQLKELLLDPIDKGVWKPGELIPGEQELQKQYGLSRTTVRQALLELELEGKVSRHRGRGTFVAEPKLTHSPQPKASLTDSLRERGMKPGWRVVAHGTVAAPADIAAELRLRPGTRVTRLARLRLANDEPIGIHVAYVAPRFALGLDDAKLEQGGSLDYLGASEVIAAGRAERVIEAVPASTEDSLRLDVPPGAPMLRIHRVVATADGEPIETMRATYRGDRFQYRLSNDA